MKKVIQTCIFLLSIQMHFGQVVINELDADTPGVDNKEFVELKSDMPNFALDGFVLVFFNGSESGANSSYFTIDLDGFSTDVNGLLLIGSSSVTPFPQLLISENVIQNGADAVAIYLGSDFDFPEETEATTTNLIDALVYDTNDPDDVDLMALLGITEQISEGPGNNTNSIQRFVDINDVVSYMATTPTPRALNDGSGVIFNALSMATNLVQYGEGDSFDITFTAQENVTQDLIFNIALDNGTFNTSDFSGNTTLTIPNGQNSVTTTITLIDDSDDEGDEELLIQFTDLQSPFIPFNNNQIVRVVDNDFTIAPWGTPLNPTFDQVTSTQPSGYYNSLDGLADTELRQALQDIIADPNSVRAQTYADIIAILKDADQNPANSNQVWLVYTEQGRAKLDFQTGSVNNGKWNREHTYPRSRGGFFNIEDDDFADGVDVFWTTEADSLRHGNSDAHALRAADGPENSSRGNQHYGEYNGPSGTLGSFKGDVARSVLFMEIRYNGLEVVDGFPNTVGQFGDLATILDWHRNDPPDDFEMNRNNIVYTWQFNRNPFIDQPDLVEYIWGDNVGDPWSQPLSVETNTLSEIKIFPNPTQGQLHIYGLSNEANIKIYTSDGRQLYSTQVSANPIVDLNLSSGLYYIKIVSNQKSITKKLIIK